MGATKRTAELLIQQRADECNRKGHKTHFALVRFGNVLGSRGSVVPIFLRQIAAGGPVTITHEDDPLLMTIPQAVRLVLQAATLASRGDVYLLDMGDPVKIIDFARDIIRLAGLTPGKDIEIKVVGRAPGRNCTETVEGGLADCSDTIPRRLSGEGYSGACGLLAVARTAGIRRSCPGTDAVIQELLCGLPIDYSPEQSEESPMAMAN